MRALVTRKDAAGVLVNQVEEIGKDQLPAGDVLVAVEWSSLNFKDGLCLTGQGNLVKSYPNVAGIDFAGRVVESTAPQFAPGQAVILTGWRVGELHWGGYAQLARVRSEWLVPLPRKLSTRDAMVLGTAGLTAMLAINRLKGDGLAPEHGSVLVTGAGGGVGSLAVMLLARLGYKVVAVTGRAALGEELRRLGASEILAREELTPSPKVLDRERFAAAIDSVGGPMLASVLKQLRYGGAVASIGAAASPEWQASVIPFILRAVSLLGIDSVMVPLDVRMSAWDRVADLYLPTYEPLVTEAGLEELPALAGRILRGDIAGRVIVNPRDPPT